jgi:hypothetical protein
MKWFLRAIAIVVAVAVALTIVMIVQFALSRNLGALARSGVLGVITILGWMFTLAVGPIAAVQLWRLRRAGLFLAASLCGLAAAYFLIGLLWLRSPEAPLTPIVVGMLMNGILVAVLLSPAARSACARKECARSGTDET